MSDKKKKDEKSYGGQAVIEGVMMLGKKRYTVALLKPDKEYKVISEDRSTITEKYKFLKWPFFRGVVMLFENLVLGTKVLLMSANEAMTEEEREKEEEKQKKQEKGLGKLAMSLSVFFAFVVGIGLFMLLPKLVVQNIVDKNNQLILFNLIDGVFRIALFLLYILLISLMKDVRRVFEFHGAEHKSVNTYEAGKPLDFDIVKTYPTYHPRCGTSFVFFVLLLSILVFSFVDLILVSIPGYKALSEGAILNQVLYWLIRVPSHLIFLPLVAGISYEVLKLSFKNQKNIFFKIFAYPGKLIQKLTVKEPDDDQLWCGIKALQTLIDLDNKQKADTDDNQEDKASEKKQEVPQAASIISSET